MHLQHTAELLLTQSHVRGCYVHNQQNQQLQLAKPLLVKVNKLKKPCHQHKQSGRSAAILRALRNLQSMPQTAQLNPTGG